MTPKMKEAGAKALAWSGGKSKAWASQQVATVWREVAMVADVHAWMWRVDGKKPWSVTLDKEYAAWCREHAYEVVPLIAQSG